MKPFNLKEAMLGRPLCMRDGTAVRFGAYVPGARESCQLIIVTPNRVISVRYINGRTPGEVIPSPNDIFMVGETKHQEVYLYKTSGKTFPFLQSEFRVSLLPNISCWELVGKSTVTWEE